ncbi:Protein Wnt-10b [Trachymyrmex zeteki]|uniref:Protein Wnt n=1 Tax=Mycetomoellerius zeteki TaxID=64791 RepID=A0A151XEK7_9HYME|nr:Protein Wnt-10b [Trachymyrmex zeteki]
MSNSVDDWVSGSAVVCNGIPGLTKDQRELCHRNPDVTVAAIKGLQMAISECQHQFMWHRWNCSSLTPSSRTQQSSVLLQRDCYDDKRREQRSLRVPWDSSLSSTSGSLLSGERRDVQQPTEDLLRAPSVPLTVEKQRSRGTVAICIIKQLLPIPVYSRSFEPPLPLETAFAYAISAAGVAHNVARACSMGRLLSCSCDPLHYMDNPPTTTRDVTFKWGGCSHNLEYGMEFSRQFLDTREKAGDIQSTVNLHNNQAGRLALANNMQIRCKCHGMSGSCELKTCWKIVPDFRVVGKVLKNRFRNAVLVTQSNLGSVIPSNRIRGSRRRQKQKQKKRRGGGRKRKLRDLPNQLYYYQRSPNFCEQDPKIDIPGTAGRRCNKTSTGGDGCSDLCCGRGYNVVRQRRTERCRCKFHWCCFVQCQNCTVEEWITVCK